MNIKGKLLEKYDTQTVKDTFRKREFIVEYAENPQYPEFLKFELIQSNCDQLDDISEGSNISVTFNLKGRKWTDKQGKVVYFNSLQAWRVEATSADAPASESEDQRWIDQSLPTDDDLPFWGLSLLSKRNGNVIVCGNTNVGEFPGGIVISYQVLDAFHTVFSRIWTLFPVENLYAVVILLLDAINPNLNLNVLFFVKSGDFDSYYAHSKLIYRFGANKKRT